MISLQNNLKQKIKKSFSLYERKNFRLFFSVSFLDAINMRVIVTLRQISHAAFIIELLSMYSCPVCNDE